ncbi:hypothetical protein [Falsiroseomonas oryziterrae]|nr:hypothetical protein [Roseomonas sp. NPKOSM-4]
MSDDGIKSTVRPALRAEAANAARRDCGVTPEACYPHDAKPAEAGAGD